MIQLLTSLLEEDKTSEEVLRATIDKLTEGAIDAIDGVSKTLLDRNIATPDGLKKGLWHGLITDRASGIRQRTPEWYNRRLDCIGASEIGSILGLSRYENMATVLARKRAVQVIHKAPLSWGTLFERVAKRRFAEEFQTEIICDDQSFLQLQDHISFSPDGFALVNYNSKARTVHPLLYPPLTKNEVCVPAVIEIKCPFTRIPTEKGPPLYYMPQLFVPMHYLPEVDLGIFIDVQIEVRRNPQHKADGFLCLWKDEWRHPVDLGRRSKEELNTWLETEGANVPDGEVFMADSHPGKGYRYVIPYYVDKFITTPYVKDAKALNDFFTHKIFIERRDEFLRELRRGHP